MSFRKEKKFKLSLSDMYLMKESLIGLGMTELYPTRKINSCYFDNLNLDMYLESEEGVLPRKKERIRWYNNSLKFSKETKISSIEGRFKTTEDCIIKNMDDILNLQYFDELYGNLSPSLLVRYSREYYMLKSMRVTFDTNIHYKYLRLDSAPAFFDRECVMEIKIPIDCGDDYIENIISHPTSRFSKYCRGILYFNRMI
jgi:hypothetical protein